MKSRLLRWLAILLILEMGWLHLASAQHEYEAAAYLGYLFVANCLGALLAAYGIYRSKGWGWALGAAIALASLAGYTWSRTLGLPGLKAEAWFFPYGLASVAAESLFLALLLARPWTMSLEDVSTPAQRAFWPASTLAMLAVISLAAGQWAARAPVEHAHDHDHDHGTSIEEVSGLPATSLAKLEQEYGVHVSLVAISALDSIVDVRLKIVDPDKAQALLANHAALLADGQTLVFAPRMHSHGRLKPGGILVMFFPTQRNSIRSGSQVSLVFGDVKVETVGVK